MAIAAADPDHAATREDLTEALRYLCHAARREFPVVGTPRAPTAWDRRHAAINELLSNLELFDGQHA
jgi:hypothetical protein